MARSQPGTAWRCLVIVATGCITQHIQVNAVTGKAVIQDRNDAFRSLEGASMWIAAKDNSPPLGNYDQESTSSQIETPRDMDSTSRLLAEVQETSNVHQFEEFSFSGVDSRSNNQTNGNNSEDRRSDPSKTSSRFQSPSKHGSKAFVHREEAKIISGKRSLDGELHPPPEDDPWEAYDIISGSNVVESWKVLRQAELSFYSFKYEKRLGRRRLGILPTEVPKLMPEAFSTVTMPIVLMDGSRSNVEGVPNVDWSHLFAHALVVTQELAKRFDDLAINLAAMKAESQNASLKVARLTSALGSEWQSSSQLRDIVEIAELTCNTTKNKIMFEKAAGREHRRLLELRHNKNIELMELELNVSKTLAEERLSLAEETLSLEEIGVKDLEVTEENFRRSSEKSLALIDMEAASQTARLSPNRRLAESLAIIQETAAAERGAENSRMAIIRARGEAARGQTQTVIDETFSLLGTMALSAVSDPGQLAKILAGFLCLAFVSLLVGNLTTLAARAIKRRVTKPQLVREMDLPGTLPAIALHWVRQNAKALLLWRHARRNMMPPRTFDGVILPPGLEHRLCSLASSIRASCARGAPLPHVLLHGAPGSGKSLIARKLAKACGLNTVIVSGGDVGPLGATASSELAGIFRWTAGVAKRGTGVALIMDEAEAALGDRRRAGMSENARSALNAILLHTGEARPGFMMVLTTSLPQDVDEAMLDRVDEVVHLPAPTLAERNRLARHYFSVYLHHDPPSDLMEAGDSIDNGIDTNHDVANIDIIQNERTPLPSIAPEQEGGCQSKENGHIGDNKKNDGSKDAQNYTERTTQVTSGCDGLARDGWIYSFLGIGQRAVHYQRRLRGCLGGSLMSSTFEGSKSGGNMVRLSEDFSPKAGGLLRMLAVRSEGFHGRDMARLFSAIQAAVYSSEDCTLTRALWEATEKQKLREFSARTLMTASASASYAAVAGRSFEDKEGGERTRGVGSTGKEAREIPRSDGIDLKVVSTRQGLECESPAMAQARVTDSTLTNGISGASPTLKLAEDCGFPVSRERLLKSNDPEVTCPEERTPSFAGTGSVTPSPKRTKRKRVRRASSNEPAPSVAVKLGVPLASEKTSSYEGGALHEMTFQDDSCARSLRQGSA